MSSVAFEAFYRNHLSVVEGGVVDHPDDRGGATWYGISQKFLISIGQSGPLSRSQAKALAYEFFWAKHGCDSMDPVAAWCYCDALFHHGSRAAGKMLQHALGVAEDGVVGPRTLAAAKTISRTRFIERYRLRRIRYFVAILKARPSQMSFMVGWMDRVHALNQSMLIAGLLKEEVDGLPWATSSTPPDRALVDEISRVLARYRDANP